MNEQANSTDGFSTTYVSTGYSAGQTWSYAPASPTDCKWHLVQDQWVLVGEDDGQVLARVCEERGLWVVAVDDDPLERYIALPQAKARAEDWAGPVNIVHTTRQNSAGITP